MNEISKLYEMNERAGSPFVGKCLRSFLERPQNIENLVKIVDFSIADI